MLYAFYCLSYETKVSPMMHNEVNKRKNSSRDILSKTCLFVKSKIMYPNMKIHQNQSWENWGLNGCIFGALLIIIGSITQILELPRIVNGPKTFYPMTNYSNHWWPWAYAASIFGLYTLLTGITGILAGLRRTYGIILNFCIMCLLSTLFALYLIAYFSILISFYQNSNSQSGSFTDLQSTPYALACVQLAVASINAIISLISAVFAGRAIALGVPKGVYYGDVQPMPYKSNENQLGF